MTNITSKFRKNIASLAPYSTARDEYQGEIGVYLDANENPYNNGYNRYPDPYQKVLKARISQIKGVPTENIFIGNGSDEPIDLAFRVFCEPGRENVVSIAPTYGMYKVAAAINDVECREVQLEADYSLDVDKLLAATDLNTKVVFLCSPNNPTANSFTQHQIERVLREFDGVVVVDEAYIDFSAERSFIERLDEFPNLIVLQTLSKAWAMAGLRLGLAIASAEIVAIFTRVKYPYNINIVTQKLVLDQLSKPIDEQVTQIVEQRAWVVEQLGQCGVIRHTFPSDANFVLVRVDEPRKVYTLLTDSGIIVRDRSKIRGCEGCLRITIGTPEENRKLIEVLKTVL